MAPQLSVHIKLGINPHATLTPHFCDYDRKNKGEDIQMGTRIHSTLSLLNVALLLSGCGFVAPELNSPENPIQNPVTVKPYEIIRRIKCELYVATIPLRAIDPTTKEMQFGWFKNWTAKVDISLSVDDTSSLSPSVNLIRTFHNAYDPNAGASMIPIVPAAAAAGNLASIAQKATLGLGAGISGQATLTDEVDFTMAISDVHKMNDLIDDVERGGETYRLTKDKAHCDFDQGFDLNTSNIGLKAWIDSLMGPITPDQYKTTELTPGDHKQGPASTAKLPGAGSNKKKDGKSQSVSAMLLTKQLKDEYLKLPKPDPNTVVPNQQAARTSFLNNYENIDDNINILFENNNASMEIGGECSSKVGLLYQQASKDSVSFRSLKAKIGNNPITYGNLDTAAESDTKIYKLASQSYRDLTNQKLCKPSPPDAPYDSISTVIQFVVTKNLSASPNWSMAKISAPAAATNGTLLSFSRADTHMVTITLAPTSDDAKQKNNSLAFTTAVHAAVALPQQ